MLRTRFFLAAAALSAFCLLGNVRADDPPPNSKNPAKDGGKQDKNAGKMQDQKGQVSGPNSGGAGDGMAPRNISSASDDLMQQQISQQLHLTDQQQAPYQKLYSSYRQHMMTARTGDPAENEAMRNKIELLQKARANHDESAVGQIRAEIAAHTQKRLAAMQAAREGLLSDLGKIITPDQKSLLGELRQSILAQPGQHMMVNPRLLRQVVTRLQLGPEQRTRINALFDHFQAESRNAGPSDRMGERRDASMRLTDAVMKELTADQRAEVQRLIQEDRDARAQNKPAKPAKPKQP